MVALMGLLLSLLCDPQLLLLSRLLRRPLAVSELFQPVFALLLQVRGFLDFGLVEPVYDGVFALLDVDALDLGS
jgi:hypothetical protein